MKRSFHPVSSSSFHESKSNESWDLHNWTKTQNIFASSISAAPAWSLQWTLRRPTWYNRLRGLTLGQLGCAWKGFVTRILWNLTGRPPDRNHILSFVWNLKMDKCDQCMFESDSQHGLRVHIGSFLCQCWQFIFFKVSPRFLKFAQNPTQQALLFTKLLCQKSLHHWRQYTKAGKIYILETNR